MSLSEHIKQKRKKNGLTQVELAERAGVGLRFVRDLEQGKQTLRMDKVNDVLALFGEYLGPVKTDIVWNRLNTFMTAFVERGISVSRSEKMIEQMKTHLPKWKELISQSFLPEKMKVDYYTLLDKRKRTLDVIK